MFILFSFTLVQFIFCSALLHPNFIVFSFLLSVMLLSFLFCCNLFGSNIFSCVLLHCTLLYSTFILFSLFYNCLLCCGLFSFALLSWTGRPHSPEKSLRISGSTLPLLLPAVSRAYKQAGVCKCVSM